MKLVKIQDKHIINKDYLPKWQRRLYDGNGCHTYILYDYKNKKGAIQYNLLATSHFYDPDKVTRIRKKNAILMKFKSLREPTTVTNVRYSQDLNGRQFSPKYKDMEVIGDVSAYQERRIRKLLADTSLKSTMNKKKKARR